MVDSADAERLVIAKQELMAMLEEDELREAILLVFANKQDQRGALNASQVRPTKEMKKGKEGKGQNKDRLVMCCLFIAY